MRKKVLSVLAILASAMICLIMAVSAQGISRLQMEAQVTFFHNALSEFGATTADQAVELWGKGDASRNGVYKYAVSCDELKRWLFKRWGAPENHFWIIGGSSPWLTSYKVISKEDLSPTEIQYVVQYEWATSAGPEAPSKEQLLIKKMNDKWCVTSTVFLEGSRNY